MTFLRRLPTRAAAFALGLLPAAFVLPSPGCDDSTCGSSPSSLRMTVVTHQIRFAIHEEGAPDGVVEGVNVDGDVSTGYPDPTGCVIADEVDPEGRVGIDNAMSRLFSTIIGLTGDAVYGLIETSIEDGSLLIMVQLDGVDDVHDDPCVDVTMLKGSGRPELGTDGSIAPDQTFGVDAATPVSHGRGSIRDGVLLAGPFEAVVPLSFFQVRVNMRFHNAYIRGAIAPDGSLGNPYDDNPDNDFAILGGGVEIEQIFDLADQAGAMDHNAATLARTAHAVVPTMADLDYDLETNACHQLSAALKLRTTPAHLLGDPL